MGRNTSVIYNWVCSTKILITNKKTEVAKVLAKKSYSLKMKQALASAIKKSMQEPKGLAPYLSKEYIKKISSIIISYDIESSNLIIEVVSTQRLRKTEVLHIEHYLQGQLSDGWGEGFEQIPFYETKTMDYQMFTLYETLKFRCVQ